jgi:hypothetical protein
VALTNVALINVGVKRVALINLALKHVAVMSVALKPVALKRSSVVFGNMKKQVVGKNK